MKKTSTFLMVDTEVDCKSNWILQKAELRKDKPGEDEDSDSTAPSALASVKTRVEAECIQDDDKFRSMHQLCESAIFLPTNSFSCCLGLPNTRKAMNSQSNFSLIDASQRQRISPPFAHSSSGRRASLIVGLRGTVS